MNDDFIRLNKFYNRIIYMETRMEKKGGRKRERREGDADEGLLGFSHILSIFLKHIKSWLPKGNASNSIY